MACRTFQAPTNEITDSDIALVSGTRNDFRALPIILETFLWISIFSGSEDDNDVVANPRGRAVPPAEGTGGDVD
jgi:hypothetical protein